MPNAGSMGSYSIRSRLLILLLLVFLPSLGIVVSWGLERRNREIADARNNALLLADSLAAQQQQVALGTEQMLSTLAQLPQVQNGNVAACNRLFRELKERYPFYVTIGAVTSDGVLYSRADPFTLGAVNIENQKHVRDVLSSHQFSTGEYIVGRLSKIPTIHYSYPVFDAAGRLSYAVIAGFKLEQYAPFLEKTHLPKGSVAVILDHRGVRLYRQPESAAAAEGKPVPDDAFKLVSGADSKGTFELVSEDGVKRIYAFKQLRLKDGAQPYLYMVVGIPKEAVLRQANREMAGYLSVLGLIAVTAAVLAWFFGNRFLADPFSQLVAVTWTLRQREAELEEAQRLAHIGAWSWDPEHDVYAASDEVLRIFGLDPAKDVMPAFKDQKGRCYPAEDWEKLYAAMQESLRTGESCEQDVRAKRDGERIWVTTRCKVVRDHQGQAVGLRGTVQDITERKRMEVELRESRARLEAALASMVDAVFISDTQGRFIEFNDAFATFYRFPNKHECLKTFSEYPAILDVFMADGEPAPSSMWAVPRALRGESASNVEYSLRRKDTGETWEGSYSFAPIRDKDGANLGAVVVARDITEKKKADKALRDSLEEKVSLLKEVHHRVKNNLQIVASLLGLQAGRTDNRQALDVLRDTRNRVKSMALLHETLYRSGSLARINFAIYLKDLCGQILLSSGAVSNRVKLDYRVARIQMPLEPALPCGLIASELVSNALKHGFPGERTGRVVIALENSREKTLVLSVCDDGIGLPSDFDSTPTTTLGMQLVYGLAAQLNGQIQVEAVPGSGVCFRLVFPVPRDTDLGEQ